MKNPEVISFVKKTSAECPPIKTGEVFEAEKELKELKKFHGAEGLEQVETFKEKIRYQKEGLAAIESKIVAYLDKTKTFTVSDIEKLVKADLDEYGFGNEFRKKLSGFAETIIKRSNNIKKVLLDCVDDSGDLDSTKAFERLFHRPAAGEIKVEVDNLSIYFRISNEEDFAYIASGAYKKKRPVNESDREAAQSTGGQSLSDYPSTKLRGAILIESPDYYHNDEFHLRTKLHEEQHSFNYLLKDFELSDYELAFKKHEIYKKSEAGKLETTENEGDSEAFWMFIVNNPKIETHIKDEIVSYFKGETPLPEISKSLLESGTIYDYGSSYNLLDIDANDGNLGYKYMRLVEQGIMAFAKLQEEGYSFEAIHAILFTEPLPMWFKTVQRIQGQRISPEQFEELEKKYIAPEILAEMAIAKQTEIDEREGGATSDGVLA